MIMTEPVYGELYREGANTLKAAGIAEAELDARLLLEHVMNTDRNTLYAHADMTVPSDKADLFRNLITERSRRIPLQHVLGNTEFMGLTFMVNEHVLIPRQDTECLVEEALIHAEDGDKILDMCTGSGCILLSIMNYKNEITGIGADISSEALKVAEMNSEALNIPATFIKSDLFSELEEHLHSFDMIVSNPPYIRPEVIETLEPEVKDHDPYIALYGGEDGLDYYRLITEGAKEYLKKGGFLMYEIGYDQAETVKSIMEKNGFMDVKIIKDLAGLDRVVSGYL